MATGLPSTDSLMALARTKGFQLTDRMAQAIEEAREVKRQEHCVRMVAFRRRKKETREKLREEHQQLEQQMKRCLEAVRNDIGVPVGNCYLSKMQSLQELVVEREAIQCHNAALRDAIDQYGHCQRLLLESTFSPVVDDRDDRMILPGINEDGWWVCFPRGEPSFHFYPFSKDELGSLTNSLDPGFASKPPSSSFVGTLFGWEVHRVPLLSEPSKPRSLHAWFTKRLNCSLDEALKISIETERELCPILATPMDWNFNQRRDVVIQSLQDFNPMLRVMVHSIPGPKPLRYLCCVRRKQWELHDGRRKLQLSMMIIDSKANKISREAEGPQSGTEWVTEGGAYATLTEVDDTTIDVTYEHHISTKSELQAAHLLVRWCQCAVRWEGILLPSSLLC
ncbi:hypothetical protein PHYBOEH_010450 [Phytophthora boehmeriae]|uniref:Uncharacterized protein n=1 Tax=Phytophthora boehmeriae TaxID=109152 RepID=A0A8T1X310_9STRA|nr:hypothetical protein PHYBOEH_010450 [Phytophthora boehmeriae]